MDLSHLEPRQDLHQDKWWFEKQNAKKVIAKYELLVAKGDSGKDFRTRRNPISFSIKAVVVKSIDCILLLCSLFKNCMHREIGGSAEILLDSVQFFTCYSVTDFAHVLLELTKTDEDNWPWK